MITANDCNVLTKLLGLFRREGKLLASSRGWVPAAHPEQLGNTWLVGSYRCMDYLSSEWAVVICLEDKSSCLPVCSECFTGLCGWGIPAVCAVAIGMLWPLPSIMCVDRMSQNTHSASVLCFIYNTLSAVCRRSMHRGMLALHHF